MTLEGGMGKKILHIDDDTDLQAAIRLILSGAGYAVANADDGTAGLAAARADRPDLVILDVMMTRVNEGIEVAQQFKGDPALAGIPILMLSGVDSEFRFGFGDSAGSEFLPVDRFLDKPVEPAALLAAVRELIN